LIELAKPLVAQQATDKKDAPLTNWFDRGYKAYGHDTKPFGNAYWQFQRAEAFNFEIFILIALK